MHGVPDQVTCTYQYYYYHYYYCCCRCRHFPFHMKRKQAVIRWVASPPLNPVSFEPNTLLLLFCCCCFFFVTILFPHKSRIFCRAKLTEIITNCCQLEDRHICALKIMPVFSHNPSQASWHSLSADPDFQCWRQSGRTLQPRQANHGSQR